MFTSVAPDREDEIAKHWKPNPFSSTRIQDDPDVNSTVFPDHLWFPGRFLDLETGMR